jgi:TPR repeat protein
MHYIFIGVLMAGLIGSPARANDLDDSSQLFLAGRYTEAATLMRKVADQGNATAQGMLGYMYREGKGVPQDFVASVNWYRKAASQGDAEAMGALGLAYHNGEGVPQDYAAAVDWYRMGATLGDSSAQTKLGLAYYLGEGVPQVFGTALRWFLKAADQDNAKAKAMLGVMFFSGQGIPQDYAQSHMWSNLAAASATDLETQRLGAKTRDLVAAKMTPAQIAEAQASARAWRPKVQIGAQ